VGDIISPVAFLVGLGLTWSIVFITYVSDFELVKQLDRFQFEQRKFMARIMKFEQEVIE
jgi:hypothetical protein